MKVFLFVAEFAVIFGAVSACRFPPDMWCSSIEIAIKCKVYKQCSKSAWSLSLQAPPVDLELYYESLCPDCRNFIKEQLFPTYQEIGEIMNITLVPYGNAREKHVGDKWKFDCQHGEEECVGNLLETCAIHVLKDIDRIMPFIHCMELSEKSMLRSVKSCAHKEKVSLDPILSCFNSSLGNQLEHQMALKTDALKPSHQYVPWIVLNGVHTEQINDEATKDLLKLVCKTYTGFTKPAACLEIEAKPSVCRKDKN